MAQRQQIAHQRQAVDVWADRVRIATDDEDLGDGVFVDACSDLLDMLAALDQAGGNVRHGVMTITVQLGR